MVASKALQAAMMVLKTGESSSDKPENEHPKSEQWLLVISGEGHAKVAGRSIDLKTGSLLVIEHAEPHQITNTGKCAIGNDQLLRPARATQARAIFATNRC